MAEEDPYAYLSELEGENKELKSRVQEQQANISNTSFNPQESNLSQWQVESDDILEKIEHFLKGDVITDDGEGNVQYNVQTNDDLIILNEYGVNSVMQILGNYINKYTVLSYYTEDRIYEILADIGDELGLFIYCNYEKMGMTTEFKKSRYILLVINILHIIESAYRRALHGNAMEQINSNTNIIQNESFGTGRMGQPPMPKRRFNLFNPGTWR